MKFIEKLLRGLSEIFLECAFKSFGVEILEKPDAVGVLAGFADDECNEPGAEVGRKSTCARRALASGW